MRLLIIWANSFGTTGAISPCICIVLTINVYHSIDKYVANLMSTEIFPIPLALQQWFVESS